MLQRSLESLQNILSTNFPDIERIYVNNVPEDFVRPSFFIVVVTLKTEQLTKIIKNVLASLRIYYFGPMDDNNNTNLKEDYSVMNTLSNLLALPGHITAPDGTVLIVNDITTGIDNGDIVCNVSLEAQITNEIIDNNETMQDIIIKQI
jgi:hypothetical protein